MDKMRIEQKLEEVMAYEVSLHLSKFHYEIIELASPFFNSKKLYYMTTLFNM